MKDPLCAQICALDPAALMCHIVAAFSTGMPTLSLSPMEHQGELGIITAVFHLRLLCGSLAMTDISLRYTEYTVGSPLSPNLHATHVHYDVCPKFLVPPKLIQPPKRHPQRRQQGHGLGASGGPRREQKGVGWVLWVQQQSRLVNPCGPNTRASQNSRAAARDPLSPRSPAPLHSALRLCAQPQLGTQTLVVSHQPCSWETRRDLRKLGLIRNTSPDLLSQSGISPSVACERGYLSRTQEHQVTWARSAPAPWMKGRCYGSTSQHLGHFSTREGLLAGTIDGP
ncbi:hypothetical protein NQZ68_009188 [Dissostichus eleginoides]|nr:hypothetical protein NQZ68_009188 [Dissostichus eleginoides]